MTASRADRTRAELGWDLPLRYRRGAKQQLRGIDVFHDLRWTRDFSDRRVQFVNGQCLADKDIEDCPVDKRPALLLTDRDDIEEGARETDTSYVMVVNLPHYLQTAQSNAAASYRAQRLGRGITRAKSFSGVAEATADELAEWLDDQLDAAVLTRWAGDSEERLGLLRTIATPAAEENHKRLGDVERALAAIGSLEKLDPRIAEAVAMLVAAPDIEERAQLLWALTEDADGRLSTGKVLQARTFERLEDAREAARQFDRLLKKGSETEVQHFLEANPWLLGLDYAQIRARQPVPRGAGDFLLERFDGFHDLLELKGPDDAIFERHGKDVPIRSPSSYRPLSLALAQVHAYRDVLSYEEALEDLYGLPHSREPRITILIGRVSTLSDHEKRLLKELKPFAPPGGDRALRHPRASGASNPRHCRTLPDCR